jgi:hypothetical protein
MDGNKKSPLKLITMSLTTKGSSGMKKYRERLKSNPELYKTAKQSHAAYMKMKRSEWTEEKGNNKLIRYTRACDMYRDFLYRAKLLSQKLLSLC